MKLKLLANKYYYPKSSHTRINVKYDYDTSGELDPLKALTEAPCFAQANITTETEFEKRVVIWNGGGNTCLYIGAALITMVEYGFLVYCPVDNDTLVPLMDQKFVDKSVAVSEDVLKGLITTYHLQNVVVVNESSMPAFESIYHSVPDLSWDKHSLPLSPDDSKVYLRTVDNKLAYAMNNHLGEFIDHITDIESNEPIGLYKYMAEQGHTEEYRDSNDLNQAISELRIKVSFGAIAAENKHNGNIDAEKFKKLLDNHPNLEVIHMYDSVIKGDLPDLSLPHLRSLIIDTTSFFLSRLSGKNIKKIIAAAPKLHTCLIHNAVDHWKGAPLILGKHLKLLSISYDLLAQVRLPLQNSLIGLEVTPPQSGTSVTGLLSPKPLESLVASLPKLQFLNISTLAFTRVPQNIPSSIHVEYSGETALQLKRMADQVAAQDDGLYDKLSLEDVRKKLVSFITLRYKNKSTDPRLQNVSVQNVNDALLQSFLDIIGSDKLGTPQTLQNNWSYFIDCIEAWDDMSRELSHQDSIGFRVFARLEYEMGRILNKRKFEFSAPVFSWEKLWLSPPEQPMLVGGGDKLTVLKYDSGFWYFYVPGHSLIQPFVVVRGNELGLEARIKDTFGTAAMYLLASQTLQIDFHPQPNPAAVMAYIRADGFLNLVMMRDQEALALIPIDTLEKEDFAPLFKTDTAGIPVYELALQYEPDLVRSMLRRYRVFDCDFQMPETIKKPEQEPEQEREEKKFESTFQSEKPQLRMVKKRVPAFLEEGRVPDKDYPAQRDYWASDRSSNFITLDNWLKKPLQNSYAQSLLIRKLQDFLALRFGIDETSWAVINTLESGIHKAIACSFGDYWIDTDTSNPKHLIFGWRDACDSLQYWNGVYGLPSADSKTYGLLQNLWVYSFHMYYAQGLYQEKSPDERVPSTTGTYQYQYAVTDLNVLFQQYLEQLSASNAVPTTTSDRERLAHRLAGLVIEAQPLVITQGERAITCLYRGGLWYYFNPDYGSREPLYYRRGDESLLCHRITQDLPGPWVIATRRPLAMVIGQDNTGRLSDVRSQVPTPIGHPILALPSLTNRIDFDPLPAAVLSEGDDDSLELFPPTILAKETITVNSDDPDLSFLCQISLDSQPQQAKPIAETLPCNMSLLEFDSLVLNREGQNTLLKFSNQTQLNAYLDYILTTQQGRDRGVWIVNSMQDLQCYVDNIEIDPENRCKKIPAPAGKFYQFLQKPYPKPIIALNLSEMTRKETVQINPIWDSVASRTVDNTLIAPGALVLSFVNANDPNAYLNKDFLFRHDGDPIEVPEDLEIPQLITADTSPFPALAAASPSLRSAASPRSPESSAVQDPTNKSWDVGDRMSVNVPSPIVVTIDLYHSLYWQTYLFGHFSLGETSLQFKPSDLLAQTYTGPLKIILKNAPLELAEFRQTIYKIAQDRRIDYHGRTWIFPQDLTIEYVEGYSFRLDHNTPTFTRDVTQNYDASLNPTTLNHFFVMYRFTENGLITEPGKLESHAGRALTVYVTRNLPVEDWSKFFHQMLKFQCKVTFILATSVSIPTELSSQLHVQVPVPTALTAPTHLPYVSSFEGYHQVISMTGLTESDLFYKLYHDDQGVLREERRPFWTILRTQHARVLLVGVCSPKLLDVLWDIAYGKGYNHHGTMECPLGRIDFLDPSVDMARLRKWPILEEPIPDYLPPDEIDTSDDLSLSIAKAFHQESLDLINNGFKKSPILCLIGHTGNGKTHTMRNFPGVIFGDIKRWIKEGGPLFLDEANLKQINWFQFESLLWQEPSVFYDGQYHKLSADHRIVVAMNPSTYSGERHTPELLKTSATVVTFTSFPNAYLYHEMLLPILGDCQGRETVIADIFLKVYQLVKSIDAEAISTRELQQMAYAFKAVPLNYSDDDQACALYHAYNVAEEGLSISQRRIFHRAFIQKWRHKPEPYRVYPDRLESSNMRFELLPQHHQAYAALEDFMAIRQYKMDVHASLKRQQDLLVQEHPTSSMLETLAKAREHIYGGLSGFILDGPPGTGKSLFIRLYLLSKGYQEDIDFYYIPAKWLPARKIAAVLRAFHNEQIVILEEFNTSDFLEETLNAVLSYIDLDGKRAKGPGFVLFGTQNPSDLGGRNEDVMAILRRIFLVHFSEHSTQNMFDILIKQGISPIIAYKCVHLRLQDEEMDFRKVYKLAQQDALLPDPTAIGLEFTSVFVQWYQAFSPLSIADQHLLKTVLDMLPEIVYQGLDGAYYWHNATYCRLKNQENLSDIQIRVSDNTTHLLRRILQRLTKPRVPITESILAHMTLDMEMPGGVGLQGENPAFIMRYFAQCIADLRIDDPRMLEFAHAIDELTSHLHVLSVLNDKQKRTCKGLQDYCNTSAQNMIQSTFGQTFYFYGGWQNQPPGSSHSLIYRFIRAEQGLRFFIYNAGAGLNEHDKTSDLKTTRYYPAKIYDIPNPSEQELSNLLQCLILPRLLEHPARSARDEIVDGSILYHNIEKILEHMDMQPVLASGFLDERIATKGVMAGACTLAIQQLMNGLINDPIFYRSLMCAIKFHTLQDYIKTHPAPRQMRINELLLLEIENNLKMLLSLSDDGMHWSWFEPRSMAQELRTLKTNIQNEPYRQDPKMAASVRVQAYYALDCVPEPSLPSDGINPIPETSLGDLMQTEQKILALTEPQSSMISTTILTQNTQVYQLSELEDLQKRYHQLYEICYGNQQLPRLFVIQACLLDACANLAPDLSACFQKELGVFFNAYRYCAHLTTRIVDLDQRFAQILEKYTYKTIDYDSFFMKKYRSFLNNSDPSCVRVLEETYANRFKEITTPIHLEIRKQRVQALFVLLDELDDQGSPKSGSTLNQEIFRPLLNDIQTQMRVENFIVQGFRFLVGKPMPEICKPVLVFKNRCLKLVTQLSSAAPSHQEFVTGPNALANHVYPIPDSVVKDVLQRDVPEGIVWKSKDKQRLRENDIQLIFNKKKNHRMTKFDLFVKQLAHLRLCLVPEHQIILTLDYFIRSAHHVSEVVHQYFVEANLLQSGLLLSFTNTQALLQQWDQFFSAAMRECQDQKGSITLAGLSLLRTQYYLNQYFNLPERLRGDFARFNELLSREDRKEVASTLHQYRFMTIMALGATDLYGEAYISFVYMQALAKALDNDTATTDDVERRQYEFQQWLMSQPAAFIAQWMQTVLIRYPWLGQAAPNSNLITGKLVNENLEVSPMPLSMQSRPILSQLGVRSDLLCGVSRDEKLIVFGMPDPKIRALKKDDRWVFQKKWAISGVEDWYELCPMSTAQIDYFGLDPQGRGYPFIKHHLPAWLSDSHTQAWVHLTEPHNVLFAQNGVISYMWSGGTDLDRIQDGVCTATVSDLPIDFMPHIAQFEEPQFVTYYHTQFQHMIRFERYGFDLIYYPEQRLMEHPETKLPLSDKSASPFAPNVACLTFANNGKPCECLVPIQPFYVFTHEVQTQTIGDYFILAHDTCAHIPACHLAEYWKEQKIPKKSQLMWRYQHSEQIMRYRLEDGKPIADTPEQALYLSYIYLATHRVEEALEVLNQIGDKGGLVGNLAELTFIEWIVNKLPAIDKMSDYTDERNKDEALASPRYIVCQLKALGLLAACLQQDRSIQIPNITSSTCTDANAQYNLLTWKALQKMLNNLTDLIAIKFERYQAGERYTSESFKLSSEERECLLGYIYEEGSPVLGPLGYERLKLSLERALKLEQHLQAIKPASTAVLTTTSISTTTSRGLFAGFNTYAQSRSPRQATESKLLGTEVEAIKLSNKKNVQFWSEVQNHLNYQIEVGKISTRLEEVSLDLSLPPTLNENMLQNTPTCLNLISCFNVLQNPRDVPDSEVIAGLSSCVSGEEFLYYLPNLIQIARRSDSCDPQIRGHVCALSQFCKASLRGARYVPLTKQDSPVPYLVNVLYRIIANPGCLESKSVYSWEDLIALVSSLNVPPITMLQAQDVYADTLSNTEEILTDLRKKMCQKQLISQPKRVDVSRWDIRPDWRDTYTLAAPYSKIGTEHEVGKAMYRQVQEKRRIATEALRDAHYRLRLRGKASTHQQNLERILVEKWRNIEQRAHVLPTNVVQAQRYANELSASIRHLATKQDLLRAYLHQDRADYCTITALTCDEEVDRLHDDLHEYVTLSVQCQKMQRLQRAIDEGNYYEIAETLTQESPLIAQQDPCLMLFQYAADKLLWPIQAAALQRLLAFDGQMFQEIVEKMMMGKGKSKVILPILAQKKAMGTNLVVVEVPPALLNTQHSDMNQLSRQLFGQTAHRFEFHRDSDCSAKRLKQIFRLFSRVSVNKDYLVTTGESMQSLHLKYRELLLSKPKNQGEWPEWRQQVMWAEKIVRLLKESGDAMIDEVHAGLWQKRKRNYTLGKGNAVDPKLIEYSLQLYQFLDCHPECKQGGSVLIRQLLSQKNSPLFNYVPKNLRDTIAEYLNNTLVDIPRGILQLDPKVRDMLAFYKEQAGLLPKTFARKYKEKYGPSKKSKKAPSQRAQSIPYIANNVPSAGERSQFSNVLETVNFTIQGLMQQGLDDGLLAEAIQQWQDQARQMLQENPDLYSQWNDTPIADGVNKIFASLPSDFSNLSLQTIDLKKPEHRAQLAQLRHYQPLIYKVLQDCVLPGITQDQSSLHADAYDHVDLYHSVQGLSGTPWNHWTYKRLQFDENTALGNDGYIQEVIKEKTLKLHSLPFDTLAEFIESLGISPTTHALIDICARFAGYGALDVASTLAKHFLRQGSAIQYVLYFNEDDVICALPVGGGKPAVLGTSDSKEICRKLGCTIDQYFTYYDQPRAQGTDVSQSPDANAIVLADELTHLQPFLQGCLRMRGLEQQQTLELVVTPFLEGLSLPELLKKMQDNEHQQSLEDNVVASFDQLENLIRLDLEQRIMAIDPENVDAKHRYMLAFERFFVDVAKPQDIFSKYGGIYHSDNTAQVLIRHKQELLRDWGACLGLVGLAPTRKEEANLSQDMDRIIKKAKDICPPVTLYRAGQKQYEQEMEQQKQTELELELEQLDECYDDMLVALPDQPWDPAAARALSSWCGPLPGFSKELLYSPNFAQVYAGQALQIDTYVKPVHIIYFEIKQGILTACLITQAEAREIKQKNPRGQWWLSTTRHSVLGGQQPNRILNNEQYQSLMEQIRYFDGAINPLLSEPKQLVWMLRESKKKIDYFKQKILPNREVTYVRKDAELKLQELQVAKKAPAQTASGLSAWFTSHW